MPEPKAQLVDPQGPIDVPGINATGIITATGGFVGAVQGAATGFAATTYNISAGVVTSTGFVGDVTGTASSVTKGANLSVGVMTASSFAGDVFGNAAGLSTTTAGLKLGIVSATSFAGNFTGIGSGITGTPHIQAGIMTATSFAGNFTGLASGITGTPNLMVGILTGTAYSGDGSNLTGIAATNWITNNVTANSSTTTVDLALGNVVVFNQSSNTTVSFANTGTSNIVTFIRDKDDTTTARTITWPSSVNWNGGTEPTLVSVATSGSRQIFNLLTRDEGVTWYGWETVSFEEDQKYEWFMAGNNLTGQLGQNNRTAYSSPVQIPCMWTGFNKGNAAHGDANGTISVGAKSDGTLWSWGYNQGGNLGHNDRVQKSSPTQVGTDTTWSGSYINAGRNVYVIKKDGTMWVWGYNYNGSLGLNSGSGHGGAVSSPTQLPGTTWSSIASGSTQTWGIKTDNTLWSWGYNVYGSLGQNDRTSHSSPIQIPGSWSMVASGSYSVAALKTNGTLWTWGKNASGALGLNQGGTLHYSSPTQVPGSTWRTVRHSDYNTQATKTDGTFWTWGGGGAGMNAQTSVTPGTNVTYSSPIQIPGTDWSEQHAVGIYQAAAIKTDGTTWIWGNNDERGQLGFNQFAPALRGYSSPTQLPGKDAAFVQSQTYRLSWYVDV